MKNHVTVILTEGVHNVTARMIKERKAVRCTVCGKES